RLFANLVESNTKLGAARFPFRHQPGPTRPSSVRVESARRWQLSFDATRSRLRFLRYRIDYVGLDELGSAVPKCFQVCSLDPRCFVGVHLFDGPAVARAKHDRPPIFWRLKCLLSVLRYDLGATDSAIR